MLRLALAEAEQQDVLGLEIAVDDADVVRGLQRLAHLRGDVQGARRRQRRPRGG